MRIRRSRAAVLSGYSSKSECHDSKNQILSRKQKEIAMTNKTLITGFPRIGENRELKKALESYWSGKTAIAELENAARQLRKKHWLLQKNAGIDFISVNDFSLYDNMLDMQVMVGAIPKRFAQIADKTERYFAMARGSKDAQALSMTKWFNTNYHYLRPELDGDISFKLNAQKLISEYIEAKTLGVKGKINLIGPFTFLHLSKTQNNECPISLYMDKLTDVYCELLQKISVLDDEVIVQFEEPALVKDHDKKAYDSLKTAYAKLCSAASNVKIIASTYFEHSSEATKVFASLPVWGIALDLVHGEANINSITSLKNELSGKKIIAGVVDGRNIWANDYEASLFKLEKIADVCGKENVIVSTSCSLLHAPYTIANEDDSEVKKYLAFAVEKVGEVSFLAKAFGDRAAYQNELDKNKELIASKASSKNNLDNAVAKRMSESGKKVREGDFGERIALQKKAFSLPVLPTTTIGSFPQTPQIRKLRSDFKNKQIGETEYEAGIKAYIDECIAFQESIELDVLVHGEPERNDMVEYFGEMLSGFHFTKNGWVQSYGSRCVKPPVIFADVSRPSPMTIKWIIYAQSKTDKIMKGMLTGPATILNWSFVRDDKPRSEVAKQIALALSDEVSDLQDAGIRIIQVDEAAFREGYPLRLKDRAAYERWAVDAFRLAVSSAKKTTQIHTHMCYSDFTDSMKTIEEMDADVITIETARGGNTLLRIFKENGYANEIGPGVYDIHSPRVPSKEEFVAQIKNLLEVLPRKRMWINPDCGLKTRNWEEVKQALTNMVQAAIELRR